MSSDTTKLVLNTDARTVNTKTPIRLGSPRTTRQDDRISVCRRTWVARLYYIWMQKDMGSQTLLSQYAATLIISGCRRTWADSIISVCSHSYYLSMLKDMGSQTLLSQYAEGLGQPDSIISVCSHSYYLSMLKDLGSQTLLSYTEISICACVKEQYDVGGISIGQSSAIPPLHPQHPPPI